VPAIERVSGGGKAERPTETLALLWPGGRQSALESICSEPLKYCVLRIPVLLRRVISDAFCILHFGLTPRWPRRRRCCESCEKTSGQRGSLLIGYQSPVTTLESRACRTTAFWLALASRLRCVDMYVPFRGELRRISRHDVVRTRKKRGNCPVTLRSRKSAFARSKRPEDLRSLSRFRAGKHFSRRQPLKSNPSVDRTSYWNWIKVNKKYCVDSHMIRIRVLISMFTLA
jgi:hypothetical protein